MHDDLIQQKANAVAARLGQKNAHFADAMGDNAFIDSLMAILEKLLSGLMGSCLMLTPAQAQKRLKNPGFFVKFRVRNVVAKEFGHDDDYTVPQIRDAILEIAAESTEDELTKLAEVRGLVPPI